MSDEVNVLSKDKSVIAKIVDAIRVDGWANILTGLGLQNRDKRMAAQADWTPMVRQDQEALYAGDEVAKKIIDIVPDEAMQKGYRITGISPENEKKLKARLRELRFDEVYNEAWKNDRMHGGCGIFKVMEDGGMDLPMVKGKRILALNLMNRWELTINSTDIEDDITNPRFGQPRMYRLAITEGNKTYTEPVHWSRIVQFPGSYLPRQLKKQNQYWGDSELNRLQNAIRNYSTSHDSVAAMVVDFSVPVLKMNGLAALVAANGDEKVMKRLNIINMSRSIARMVILDAEKETFEHATRQVTGVEKLVEAVEQRLVTSTNIPGTKLFGKSPTGMGGTGRHEETNWYDFLESQQNNYLKPRMLDVIKLIVETEFPQENAEEVDIKFNKLWQLDDQEMAILRKTQAETDQIYIMNGVADPSEIAECRFGGEEYSAETMIEMEMREPSTPSEIEETPEPEQEEEVENENEELDT